MDIGRKEAHFLKGFKIPYLPIFLSGRSDNIIKSVKKYKEKYGKIEIVHYDTCALSCPLLHGMKLGPERSEGPITPCNGLLKTLVSYNIL